MDTQTILTQVISTEIHLNLYPQVPVPQYHLGLGEWAKGRGPERVLPVAADVTLFRNGEEPNVDIWGEAVNKDGSRDRRFTTRIRLIGHHELGEALAEQARKHLDEPDGIVEVASL